MATPYPSSRYYDFIVAAAVTVLLCANLIGPAKIIEVGIPIAGTVTLSAGILFLPLFYTLGKIVSEVYGHERNCRVIWAGFIALAFAAAMSMIIVALSPARDPFSSTYQTHLEAMFGNTPRIVLASLTAFLCGSLVNNHVMTALRTIAHGRYLFLRTLGTTACSQLIDTFLFFLIAFYGLWPLKQILLVALAQYVLKVGCEFVMSPFTCSIVRLLKHKENRALSGHATIIPALVLNRSVWKTAGNG